MEKIIKQCIGIDCSKDGLAVCFGQLGLPWEEKYKATGVFENSPKGFKQLFKWSEKLSEKGIPVEFVIEATGVYHEKVTNYLFDKGRKISVVLPNQANHFAKTLKVRTVNDKESSKMLASFGLQKQLDGWKKPDTVFDQLKGLTREIDQLKDELTVISNQEHAEQYSAFPNKKTLKRMNARMVFIEKQIKEIKKEIDLIIESHPTLAKKLKKICTIPGVGKITVVKVIAETNGFNMIRNKKQLVAFAGYDVVTKDSGTSVHGKPHISGKGNKHIRKALHFPALTSVKYDKNNHDLFKRIEAKTGIKMKGYTAVQRKLLVLIYILWTKDEEFDPNYRANKSNQQKLLEQPIMTALTELDQVCS
jgi:transposase